MKIFVVGATGVLGHHVVPRLLERGHQVHAVVRQPAQVEQLQYMGANAFVGDILDAASLAAPLEGCEAALHLATAVPRPGQPRNMERNAQIRQEGTRYLLDAAAQAGVRRYIQQSITFVYGDQGANIADESTPIQLAASPYTTAMEQIVQESGFTWCIMRGGAFYGPTTGQEAKWREDAANGALQLPGDGSGLVSLIHEVDMARAVVFATESAPPKSVYNVVDDLPVSYRALYSYVAAQVGAPPPTEGGPPSLPPLGCSNARLKAELGWLPAYPTYRSGLA